MTRISFFGYANTTKALAKHIAQNGIDTSIVFYDDKVHKPFCDEHGFWVRPASEFDDKYSTLEIPSPGIPPYNPLITRASHLISDYDYFADSMPFSIWISGTNGKTTTTQMIQHLLQDRGSQAGGNIGTAVADMDINAPIWVLESSSFTLHYTDQARPNIYILLPITPDHLSWHGDMQSYINDKLKPLEMMKDAEIALVPSAYKDIVTSKAKIIFYKDAADLAKTFNITLDKIRFEGVFLLDAVLALCVKKILFNQMDYQGINSFIMDPHRQEELYDSQDRLWVNDTKATNPDATIAALTRYKDKHIHLILGGDDKDVDLTQLFRTLSPMRIDIYTIGANQEKLLELASNAGLLATSCDRLETAVAKIAKALKKEEVALLSPAAASLDQFQSYAHRGESFKKLVQAF
jgi:UDP-N-acetylmuramoylalanine--D-glutamate ligase